VESLLKSLVVFVRQVGSYQFRPNTKSARRANSSIPIPSVTETNALTVLLTVGVRDASKLS